MGLNIEFDKKPVERKGVEHLIIMNLEGQADLYSCNELDSEIKKAMKEVPHVLALNFKEITYIDSSGIGTLIKYWRIFKKLDIDFLMYGVTDSVMEAFKSSQIDTFLVIITEEIFKEIYYKELVLSN